MTRSATTEPRAWVFNPDDQVTSDLIPALAAEWQPTGKPGIKP